MNRAGEILSAGSDDTLVSPSKAPAFTHLDPRIHKMLGHRVRYAIVFRLGDGPATAAQLAEWLGEKPQYVSRLLWELKDEDLVEVVKEEANPKGGKTYTYRATNRYLWDAEEWAQLPEVERKNASLEICQTLNGEVGRALKAETFDAHVHRVLIRRPLWGDDQAAAEIDEVYKRADREVNDIARRSAERNHSGRPHRILTYLLSFLASPVDRS